MVFMSMKRTKPVLRGRPNDNEGDSPFSKKPPAKTYTWAADVAARSDAVFVPYSLKSKFQQGALIEHPKFGRGVVTHVEESRIDVLFEEGPKKLGHAG
jgi:hypothetical protein